ncbi:hypothetical protein BGW36DRAFT_365519 [Talaromyces proteolyticus]|uniref:Lysine-specific metallo-endopeptidase domain-containing protein n=1 Tax=Talaromyces proteolyticus TaxID=1131652 RepID=A0AAD4PU75_9EURO|nr:uncharacterized protein BGW36DRAFT_365519 [Talaromyces proteolyticus]KAH8688983.1 hypothetical protein BGW36DRAFT_365519 [Talaromyces proteolyticus]
MFTKDSVMYCIRQLIIILFIFQIALPNLAHKVSRNHSKRAARTTVDCEDNEWDQMLWDAFDDAISAAEYAKDQLGYLSSFLGLCEELKRGRNSGNTKQKMILMTFESIFGQVLYDRKSRNADEQNRRGRERVAEISGFVTGIGQLYDGPITSSLHIFCHEDFLQYSFTDNDTHDWYTDTRPAANGGGRVLDATRVSCSFSNPIPVAYSYSSAVVTHHMAVFCPNQFQTWEGYDRMSVMHDTRDWYGEAMHLDTIAKRYILHAVLHELSHSDHIFGVPGLEDVPCGEGNRNPAYGWVCITHLASNNPESAILNADSFATFVMAMYLSNADWHTGWAMPFNDNDEMGDC